MSSTASIIKTTVNLTNFQYEDETIKSSITDETGYGHVYQAIGIIQDFVIMYRNDTYFMNINKNFIMQPTVDFEFSILGAAVTDGKGGAIVNLAT